MTLILVYHEDVTRNMKPISPVINVNWIISKVCFDQNMCIDSILMSWYWMSLVRKWEVLCDMLWRGHSKQQSMQSLAKKMATNLRSLPGVVTYYSDLDPYSDWNQTSKENVKIQPNLPGGSVLSLFLPNLKNWSPTFLPAVSFILFPLLFTDISYIRIIWL